MQNLPSEKYLVVSTLCWLANKKGVPLAKLKIDIVRRKPSTNPGLRISMDAFDVPVFGSMLLVALVRFTVVSNCHQPMKHAVSSPEPKLHPTIFQVNLLNCFSKY